MIYRHTQDLLKGDIRSHGLDDLSTWVEMIDDSVNTGERCLVDEVLLVEQNDVGKLDLINK